jgi:hypothetical protein
MRIVLPYPYTVEFVRRRKGRPETARHPMLGHVVADAPEPHRDEYSKVAEWHTEKHGYRIKNTCISFLDDLYVPILQGDSMPLVRLPDRAGGMWGDGQSAWALLGTGRLSLVEQGVLRNSAKGIFTELPSNAREIVGSNMKSREATAQMVANGVIIAEGHAWKRIPWIAIEARHSGHMVHLSIKVGPTGFDSPSRAVADVRSLPPHFIRLHSLDEDNTATFGHCYKDGTLSKSYDGLKVFGSAPHMDGDRDYLDRTLSYVLNSTCSQVGYMSADAARDWMGLRHAYHDAEGLEQLASSLIPLMREMLPYVTDEILRRSVDEAIETVAASHDLVDGKAFGAALGIR